MTTRAKLLGAALAALLLCYGLVQAQRGSADLGNVMSVAEAHGKALKGEVVFVDVRTPEEWKETGLPASAHALSMAQDPRTFLRQLTELMGSDRSKPVAIICRTGNRTTMLQAELKKAGFTNVINVAEGVAGGPNGQGWLRAGLPIRPGSVAGAKPMSSVPQTSVPMSVPATKP